FIRKSIGQPCSPGKLERLFHQSEQADELYVRMKLYRRVIGRLADHCSEFRLIRPTMQDADEFGMQSPVNSRNDFVARNIKVFCRLHSLKQVLEQALRIELITEEQTIDLIEPALTFLIKNDCYDTDDAVDPGAGRDYDSERLIAVEQYISHKNDKKQRH